ncbi:MAG TPA: SMP-30/gluconolactonase/LRE family protein [Longimicrobium sp.]|jgi:sugar lactone lactonase YvrE|nr:SMP-30/gluconolactonase/LRE family protein [Longimicrobium sp.]
MAPPVRHPLSLLALAACALASGACGRTAEARDAPAAARKLHVVQGFGFPESVRYDPDQDVYFVSNMAGPGSLKDGNGFIVRIRAEDLSRAEVFVEGGKNGAVLDAPKGMAISGDTLWVADIDVVRGFHRRTGAPLATIDLRPHGAVLANDVAVGPDGSLHVTDTGIAMTDKGVMYRGGDKIFTIGPGHAVSLLAEGRDLGRPNGITWDPEGKRWIVVSFDPFRSEVYALAPDSRAPRGQEPRTVLLRGLGKFDGVERLADGRLLVTCWADSSLHLVTGTTSQRIIRDLWQPADLGVDTRRNRVAIPLVLQGRVEIWELPGD